MNSTSLTLLQTVAATDNSLSLEQRSALQDLIAGRASTHSIVGQPLLLSQKEAARMLAISRVTLWRMTKDGVFRPIEILSGTFRYRMEEIEAVARLGKEAKRQLPFLQM